MGRPPKKPTETTTEQAKPSEVQAVITKAKLKSILASARKTKADVDEIVGTHREQIANAVEKHHLHKGVFATIKRLDRMEPEKLAEWLSCFDHYLDISGLEARADSVERMALGDQPGDAEAGEETGETEPEPAGRRRAAGGNVRAFPQPSGEAAE